MHEKEYVTIATFDLLPLAHIAMGKLKAASIDCILADEHLVATNWLYSPCIGGIKLQVHPDDEARALQLLETDDSDSLNAPEND